MTRYTEKRWEPTEIDFKLDELNIDRGACTVGILSPVVPATYAEKFEKALAVPADYRVFLQGLFDACKRMMSVTSNGNALIDNSVGGVTEFATNNDGNWGDSPLDTQSVKDCIAEVYASGKFKAGE